MRKRVYKNSNKFGKSVFPKMEVILITPNAKYETLVSPSKMIQNTAIDILPLLETQVFLNHHYNVSFFILKNNFPYQFHYPLKIAKHLLDRNEGPVQLSISNGLYFKIQSDTDTLQILSNVQSSLQGVESEQHVVFLLKYWEVKIRLVVLNEAAQFDRVKQAIQNMSRQWDDYGSHDIMKIILYVDDNNYEQFLLWSQNQNCFQDYYVNQKLSKQYMTLKQEIDNEKNSFRNKIKMVEAILGENINIDKLLCEEKQQNQQYKRLRETFETIKNIDNVIIEQERKIQSRRNELKQIILNKHRTHYENAKLYAKKKGEINQMIQLNEQIRYKIQCVSKEKGHYFSKRNFQMNTQVKQILDAEVNKCKNIVRNMGFLNSKKRSSNYEPPVNQIVNKSKILNSMHESNLSQQQQLQTLMKKRVEDYHKSAQFQKNNNDIKETILIEMKKYQSILKNISKFYENSQQILNEIRKYSSSHQKNFKKLDTGNVTPKLFPPSYQNHSQILWSQSQFVVLNQLMSNKPIYFNIFLKKHFSDSNGTKIASNLSINQKFPDDDRHFEKERLSRVSMLEERPAYRTSITRIKSNVGKNNKITKVTGRPSYN